MGRRSRNALRTITIAGGRTVKPYSELVRELADAENGMHAAQKRYERQFYIDCAALIQSAADANAAIRQRRARVWGTVFTGTRGTPEKILEAPLDNNDASYEGLQGATGCADPLLRSDAKLACGPHVVLYARSTHYEHTDRERATDCCVVPLAMLDAEDPAAWLRAAKEAEQIAKREREAAQAVADAEAEEREERAEFARLKAKYEGA
jgi:hypothetical protein